MNNWTLDEEGKIVVPVGATVKLDTRIFARLEALEVTIAEHEEYFKTIEAVLSKIQAVYEALQDGRL